MSKKNILPRRNYVFASGGARIELDSDAHADIDYDFFDSKGKTMNTPVGHSTVDFSSCRIDPNHDPNNIETASKHLNYEIDESEDDDHVISNTSGNLSPPKNASTSIQLKMDHKGAGENNVPLNGLRDCDNNKSIVENASRLNRSELVNKVEGNQSNCNEAGEGCKENESDESNKMSSLQDPSQVQKKNLMNCIAYSLSPISVAPKEYFVSCKKSQSEPNYVATDSASSNTTSEITDVTSRESSSKYSLPRGVPVNNGIQGMNVTTHQGDHNFWQSQPRGMLMSLLIDPMRNMQICEQRRDSSSSSSSSVSKSSLGSSRSRVLPPRKNMSFTNDEMWKIERENECLLKKIEGKKSLLVKPQLTPPNFNLSSSAINRRKVQMRIEQENQRLVKKLRSVRSVTNTNEPWRQVRH